VKPDGRHSFLTPPHPRSTAPLGHPNHPAPFDGSTSFKSRNIIATFLPFPLDRLFDPGNPPLADRMPPSEDLMETFLDIDGIAFGDCIDGMDDDQTTLNSAALNPPKPLSADHDFFADSDRRDSSFHFEESYQEDSLSDSSSSKRASSEASSSKSSGSSTELMANDFGGDGHTIRPEHAVIQHGPSSNPHSPLQPKMGSSFDIDAYDHRDGFMDDFLTDPSSPEGMDLGESSPEAETLSAAVRRHSGAAPLRRASGHVKNESVRNCFGPRGTLFVEVKANVARMCLSCP
jgi:hypothetical protein